MAERQVGEVLLKVIVGLCGGGLLGGYVTRKAILEQQHEQSLYERHQSPSVRGRPHNRQLKVDDEEDNHNGR
ncbi:hypothetical protein CTI12_AA052970 [Artemisia annua]|uniref:Uncharacterized protein n=1 Tax=Artemisia annua TaxID=35608 RepID=A0A2U1QAU8_ARTAN|nr:hypothetical protein CTI12_AA052970 [Artemisia annua]